MAIAQKCPFCQHLIPADFEFLNTIQNQKRHWIVCQGLISADHDPLKALAAKAKILNENLPENLPEIGKKVRKRKHFEVDPGVKQNDAKYLKMSKVHRINQKYKPYDRGKDK